ncbi:MAG: cell division ATP-binding protein FtsE [Pseudomonadales bacterium]
MIELRHVHKRYSQQKDVLKNVSFSLEKGSMTFLTGQSGAGKSTLLKLIAGLERPNKGDVVVGGEPVSSLKSWELPYYRRQIGVVFQDHQLIEELSIFDNVALPLRVSGYSDIDIQRRVTSALASVGLADSAPHFPSQLSGGEQQRVGIARAVVAKPSVLIADEPTGNLDPELSTDIMGLLHRFSQVGVTVLIASHDIALIEQLGHPILHLQGGNIR